MSILPSSFRFSWKITLTSLLLACIMINCSFWQWERYKWKVKLVESYAALDSETALPFPTDKTSAEDFEALRYKKVRLRGHYDFEHEVIVLNQEHQIGDSAGPGFLLLTPYKLDNSELSVIVSRGFIPFAEDTPAKWAKFSFPEEEIQAVVQATIPQRALVPSQKSSDLDSKWFARKWLYPDIESLATQFPYPLITAIYLERIGPPPKGAFPAEAISVKVPPSTHFGYTIEWAFLATVSLVIGFLLQAFPRRPRY